MPKKRIGILTSGGDCPGLNTVLHAAVCAADKLGWETVGFRDGYEGLLPPGNYQLLDREQTADRMHCGGTLLGTTSRGRFGTKQARGSRTGLDPEIIAMVKKSLRSLRIEALIAVGGDGSLHTALQLSEGGIPLVGIPKTIDNDLEATSLSFGFDSAVNCVVDALDRLRTTAASHKRIIVVEVMGRQTGWIALHGGVAGGADVVLIPEIPFQLDRVARFIGESQNATSRGTLLVAAEGVHAADGTRCYRSQGSGEYRLGGVGERIARALAELTGEEVRTCVLGHLQRGGPPTPADRLLATHFGVHAVTLIAEKKFGRMVTYHQSGVSDVPLRNAVHHTRRVPKSFPLIRTARASGICFGD